MGPHAALDVGWMWPINVLLCHATCRVASAWGRGPAAVWPVVGCGVGVAWVWRRFRALGPEPTLRRRAHPALRPSRIATEEEECRAPEPQRLRSRAASTAAWPDCLSPPGGTGVAQYACARHGESDAMRLHEYLTPSRACRRARTQMQLLPLDSSGAVLRALASPLQ